MAQVHLVGNADRHHRLVRELHRLGHGPARALEELVAAALLGLERLLHVLLGHHPGTAAALDPLDVESQFLGQQTYRWHGLHQGAAGGDGAHHEVILDMLLMSVDLADHGAVILAAFELHQRRTYMQNVPLLSAQPGDDPSHR